MRKITIAVLLGFIFLMQGNGGWAQSMFTSLPDTAILTKPVSPAPLPPVRPQYISKKTADSLFDAQPSFTIYKDNYFITGTAPGEKTTKYNSDVKYQISFQQQLTKTTLPFHTYLFLTYTQLAFWDIYRSSKPFAEINFNPTLGLAKRLYANDRFLGIARLVFEHESNGRDSIYSRSWNRLSLSFQGPIFNKAVLIAKAWIPFGYKDDNPDILQYKGYGEAGLLYTFIPKKLLMDVLFRKGSSFSDWKGSAQTQVYYRPMKNSNGYILLQWFQGYGESLISYNTKVSMLRIGFVFKPNYPNLF